MRHGPAELPAEYVRVQVGRATVVALAPLADAVCAALADGSLHDYAARHPEARPLRGRAVAYAVPLPGGEARVVVRHSQHGGLLAALTGDRFLGATRAPHELVVALRLAAAGVPTPEMVAYVTYPAGPLLRRCDVATREVERGRDLADALMDRPSADTKRALLAATARLLSALSRAGARHPDLNIKNVLLAPSRTGTLQAYVLDVDRIVFGRPDDPAITTANLRRLARSARKWRERHGAPIEEQDLAWLQRLI